MANVKNAMPKIPKFYLLMFPNILDFSPSSVYNRYSKVYPLKNESAAQTAVHYI